MANKQKRAGRPRMVTAERDRSNRASRRINREISSTDPKEWPRLRDAALAGMANPMWGSELGRLMVRRSLTAAQFEAARRYSETCRLAGNMTGLPSPSPKTPSWARSPGKQRDAFSEEENVRGEVAKALYQNIINIRAMLDPMTMRLINSVCCNDEACAAWDLHRLQQGLEKIAVFFGLTTKTKNGRN